MVRRIAVFIAFGIVLVGGVARAGAEIDNPRALAPAPAAKTVAAPQQDVPRVSGTGTIPGLGEFKVVLTWDNRTKVAMTTGDFEYTRVWSETGESEIGIGGQGEETLIVRFGGPEGLSVAKGGRTINVTRTADTTEAVRRLVGGRAITAFRQRLGQYERQLANETGLRKKHPLDPYAYTFVLTAAFIGELAGDPNAIGRSRELIERRILSARGRPQQASFAMRQGGDCWMDYEQALLSNDTRNSQCMDSANSVAWYLRGAERLLCATEFLSGALGAESSYIGCMGLAGLRLT
jgi:hypothetical protein